MLAPSWRQGKSHLKNKDTEDLTKTGAFSTTGEEGAIKDTIKSEKLSRVNGRYPRMGCRVSTFSVGRGGNKMAGEVRGCWCSRHILPRGQNLHAGRIGASYEGLKVVNEI